MTACRLCGHASTSALFEKSGVRYDRCRQCGFRFAAAASNPNLDNQFDDFEPAYRQYLDPSPVDAANHDAAIQWIESFVPLDEHIALLDIGAGSGKFLRHVRSARPCRTAGVEPSKALFDAYDLGQLGVVNTTLPVFSAAGCGAFDVITVSDVIEHVDDPIGFAHALYEVAAPGAHVFLSTPDAGSVLASALGRFWHHYNPYHFSLFDRSTMRRLAGAAGFVTVAFAHRGKRITAAYLRQYVRDFFIRQPGTSDATATGWVLPLNTFDVMSLVWKKPA